MNRLIPFSALQHYLYCPRQCALIHIERLWADNVFTAEGDAFHETVDAAGKEQRGKLKIRRSLHIASETLGINGITDVVEISYLSAEDKTAISSVTPIEYKVGKPKPDRMDEVQLCAQALCLEEIFGIPIPQACLFYGKTRRRHEVALDKELRELTFSTIRHVHELLDKGVTPPAVYLASCKACSLINECMPQNYKPARQKTFAWTDRTFEEALSRETAGTESPL